MMLPDSSVRFLRCLFFLVLYLPLSGSDELSEQAYIEAVIEKYINSQGGRKLLESIRTFEVEGVMSLRSQGIEIPITQKIEAPDKVELIQEFPSLGAIRNVLNGNQGWEWHPITGERPLDESEVQDLLKDSDLQRDLKLFEVYDGIRLGPPETIEGIETIHLIFLDPDGRKEHWYFKENGDLFQKVHTVSAGPESELESTERFYDHQTVQGFRFPRQIKYINPAYTADLTISLCLVDQEFDAAIFELPHRASSSGDKNKF